MPDVIRGRLDRVGLEELNLAALDDLSPQLGLRRLQICNMTFLERMGKAMPGLSLR